MRGWKTWAAVGLTAVSAGLVAAGLTEYAKTVAGVAAAFGFVGIGHKIEKINNGGR